MDGREKRCDLFMAQMQTPTRLIPVEGAISNYSIAKEEIENIAIENLERGRGIQKNLEEKMREIPPSYTAIPYSSDSGLDLSNGNAINLPYIIFHPVAYNFRRRERIPDAIFSEGEKIN